MTDHTMYHRELLPNTLRT